MEKNAEALQYLLVTKSFLHQRKVLSRLQEEALRKKVPHIQSSRQVRKDLSQEGKYLSQRVKALGDSKTDQMIH